MIYQSDRIEREIAETEQERKIRLERSKWAEETKQQCKEFWLSPYGRECVRKAREANFEPDNY